MGGEKYVCLCLAGIPKKTCLCFMNRIDSLKQVHHFDAYNSNQKNEKEKRKKKTFSLQFFQIHAILQNLLA